METLDRNLARVPRAQAPLLTWPYLALPDTPTHIGILLNFKQRATADASVSCSTFQQTQNRQYRGNNDTGLNQLSSRIFVESIK